MRPTSVCPDRGNLGKPPCYTIAEGNGRPLIAGSPKQLDFQNAGVPLCGGGRFSFAIGHGRVNDLDRLAATNLFERIIGIRDTEGELTIGDIDGRPEQEILAVAVAGIWAG